ncbi:MAG: hypothetical protein ACYTFV_10615 [Planctomycetota bacterium]|jgi:hypothetical protein
MARLTCLLALALAGCVGGSYAPEVTARVPWPLAEDSWRTDSTWYDGQAEVAVYRAERVIYGEVREYEARAYTNKQRMDPRTTTKSSGSDGIEVFKHHWSERVPTERYDYDFSTACFVRTADLSTYKFTAATQEDCGASFKQAWSDGAGWRALDSVYFPDGGVETFERDGGLPQPMEALTLVLRDLVAATEAGDEVELSILPGQRDTHRVPWKTEALRATHVGPETLELPLGTLETRHVQLTDSNGGVRADYWFAADGTAPLLHALARYEDPTGLTFELTDLQRYPYWARGPR